MSASWSLAVDMGGTFIDAVALRSDGHVASLKHPRAGRRLAEPVVEALDRLCAQAGIGADDVGRVVHGSTCLLYTSPSPRDGLLSRMPSSA